MGLPSHLVLLSVLSGFLVLPLVTVLGGERLGNYAEIGKQCRDWETMLLPPMTCYFWVEFCCLMIFPSNSISVFHVPTILTEDPHG